MVTKEEYIKRRIMMLCAMCNRILRIKSKLNEQLPDKGLLEEFDHIYHQIIDEEF